MSSTEKAQSSEAQCIAKLDKLYIDLLHLVTSVEKGSGSELTVRLRNVETGVELLRESIRKISDIHVNEFRERQQISSLYEQIRLKDELIRSLANYDITEGIQREIKRESADE